MATVYVSIGNSDDNLSQAEWSAFVDSTRDVLRAFAHRMHGDWRSNSADPWQNASWCVEFDDVNLIGMQMVRKELARLCKLYEQDSITWAVAEVEFIKGE